MKKIVYIDSECLVCSKLASYIIKNSDDIYISSLKGERFLALNQKDTEKVYYQKKDQLFSGFRAIRELLKELSPFLYAVARLIPVSLGDFGYNIFAKIRKIFQKENCPYPPVKSDRFI
jgi:predicted DCC family thiol-disulfide oxidoreductase YuxK